MIAKEEIVEISRQYGIQVSTIGDVIDSSRGEEDQRYNYSINKEYMLKINNAPYIEESFLQNIADLVERYHSIGVLCPRLLRNNKGNYMHKIVHNQKEYRCYIEEYASYRTADSSNRHVYQMRKEMMWHLGKMAAQYTNIGLVDTRSMWSLIELAPGDVGIDEKQENMNKLLECLNQYGYVALAGTLEKWNKRLRDELQSYLTKLPRCVYQGDLNPSNVLVDEEDKFVGIIDFNLFGTEVNINCFMNETMYYLTEEDYEELTASEVLEKMNFMQKELLDEIYKYYKLNEIEEYCFGLYKKITYISFYPNVMLWVELMKQEQNREKVIEVIELVLEM